MSLDADVERLLALLAASGGKPFEDGTVAEARFAHDVGGLVLRAPRAPVLTVEDREIPGASGPMAARIYRGVRAPAEAAPAVLYFHGGGWVVGNLDSHDEICRALANAADAVVVSPDYRLAPEHRFPAAPQDCAAALRWLAAAASGLGVDPGRIAVAGDSAGGNLASVVALMGRDGAVPRPAAQLLLYPNTDAAQQAESYRRFATGFGLTARTMAWFRDLYVRGPADIEDWWVSPLRAGSLAGAPPAFVAIAGCDILADEGRAYALRLREAGVPILVREWPGQIHGFVSMGGHLPAWSEAIAAAVNAWRAFP